MSFLVSCAEKRDTISCVDQLSEESRRGANQVLQIVIPKTLNSFDIGDNVVIAVENSTKDIIDVAPDSDIKFYWLSESDWLLLENQIDYLSVTDQIFPKTNSDPGGLIYVGKFELSDKEAPVKVCITVEGDKHLNDYKTRVGAYVEVILKP